MKLLNIILLSLFLISSQPFRLKNSRWISDVNVLLLQSSNPNIEKYTIKCISKIKHHIPYNINLIYNSPYYDVLIQVPMSKNNWEHTGHDMTAIAETYLHISKQTNVIKKAEIAFIENNLTADTFCHEMIHALGIGDHSENKRDVMFKAARPSYEAASYKEALARLEKLYK